MGAAASLQTGPDGMPVFQLDGADSANSGGVQSLMESLNLLARMMQNALELTYPEIYNVGDFEDPEAKFPLATDEGEAVETAAVASSGAAGGGETKQGDDGDQMQQALLPRGTRVVVYGLQQSPEYNGRCGVVVKFLPGKQRYRVFLGPAFNNKHLALKPMCVRRAGDSPAETFLGRATAVPEGAPLAPLTVRVPGGLGRGLGVWFDAADDELLSRGGGKEKEKEGVGAAQAAVGGDPASRQEQPNQKQLQPGRGGKALVLQAANVANMSGWTPLHACAHSPGDVEVGRQVLEAVVASKGSVDALTKVGPGSMHGWTPLHIAAAYCVQPMVELLVDAKADVEVPQGDSGWTALQTACRRGYSSVLQVLLRAKADAARAIPASPEQPSPPHNCVALAARHGHISCLRALHESRASLDAANALGWGALHEACNMNAFEVVRFLVDAKCDLAARTKTGRTALQLCRDPLLRDMLREAGIDDGDDANGAADGRSKEGSGTGGAGSGSSEADTAADTFTGGGTPRAPSGGGSGARATEAKGGGVWRGEASCESKISTRGDGAETEAQRDERFRLLGELPDLSVGNTLGPSARLEMEHASRARGKGGGGSSRRRNKTGSGKSSSSSKHSNSKLLAKLRTNKAPHGCPEGFLCDLTGNLLQDPVRSPYGHVFDKGVIAQCLKKMGRRCPLTGNPLTKSELVPDEELQQEIREWQLARAREEGGGDEDSVSLGAGGSTAVAAAEEAEEEDPLYVFD